MKHFILKPELQQLFFAHLRTVMLPRASKPSEAHQHEFTQLQQLYNSNLQKGEDIQIEMTDSFFDTWVEKTFREMFRRGSHISRSEAKLANRLYEELFNDYNDDFLNNYNQFYS